MGRLIGALVFVLLVVPAGLARRLVSRRRSWRDGDTTRRPVEPSTVRQTEGGAR